MIVVVAVPPTYKVSNTESRVVDACVKDDRPVVFNVPVRVKLLNVGLADV